MNIPRSPLFLQPTSACLLLLVSCLPASAADLVPVRQLKQAVFRRVAGTAGQGACIATGKTGSGGVLIFFITLEARLLG